jgi:tagatose 6-phosphate kinase
MIIVVGLTPSYQRVMAFERVCLDQVNRALEVNALASGKGVNCARALKYLGKRSICLTVLGGFTGNWIESSLAEEGIELKIVKTAQQTRSCTTLLDRKTGHVTELIENAAEIDEKCFEELLHSFEDILKDCRVAVCIGTLPPGMPSHFYREILRMAHARKIHTILDTQGDALLEAVQESPTIVKINVSELLVATKLNGESDVQIKKGLQRLHEKGAKSILITRGADDPILSENGSFEMIKLPSMQVLNSTGAGDSVAAGIASALSEGKPLREAVLWGIACGSVAAAGSGYGYIDLLNVLQYYDRMKQAV